MSGISVEINLISQAHFQKRLFPSKFISMQCVNPDIRCSHITRNYKQIYYTMRVLDLDRKQQNYLFKGQINLNEVF